MLEVFRLTPAQFVLYFTVCPAIVVGIIQMLKQLAPDSEMWKRFMPLFALLFGVLIALLASQFVSDELPVVHWALQVVIGLIVGLMASGAWSQVRSLAGH